MSILASHTCQAIMPLVLFPLFGILDPVSTSSSYLTDMSFLYMGTVSAYNTPPSSIPPNETMIIVRYCWH